MTSSPRTGVLMVTGAYWPELSGGGLQARTMVLALSDAFDFRVLTTCTDRRLPRRDTVDGVPVRRVLVDLKRPHTKLAAFVSMAAHVLAAQGRFDIVHLHGFTQKSALLVLLALVFRKRIVVTIHTAGHDDPEGVKRQGGLAYWCYRRAHRFIAISEAMAERCRAAGLPPAKVRVVPNGVDTMRFRPPSVDERARARTSFGLREGLRWVLFAGLFTPDKCPDVLFDAWLRLQQPDVPPSGLMLVGATASSYVEVDPAIAERMRAQAAARGLAERVVFTGAIPDIERAFHAADVFAMPSAREAFGMVLVEAMATGLPVVASRLPGVTDTIVEEGVTGLLVPPRDADALARALARVLVEPEAAARMGAASRESVQVRYGLDAARARWKDVYRQA